MNRLLELLTEDMVMLDQRVESWEEAIRLAGSMLVRNESITQDYVEASIQAAVDSGAYFVLCPGVAISHARPGESVNKVCVSLVTINPPVNFGHPDNDPVSLLFMFAGIDNDSHVDLLKDIATILCDEKAVDTIINIENYSALKEYISAVIE